MTFGSLFTGIGGLDLGLERAGMECAWQVEQDWYAQKVLKKHWPEVPKYRDVRYFLGGKRWRQHRAAWEVDLIAGGFPCQDISNAGKREGIGGKRSGLWGEFARIVRLLRPRYVLVENVGALVVRGLDRVLGDLADLGFDAEWDRIPAAAVGAPHLRWRLFIVAYANGHQQRWWQQSEWGQDQRNPVAAGHGKEGPTADANGQREQQSKGHVGEKRGRVGDGSCENVPDAERDGLQGAFGPHSGQGSPAERRRSADAHGPHVSYPQGRWSGQRWRDEFAAYCESQRDLFWPDAEPGIRGTVDGFPCWLHRVIGRGMNYAESSRAIETLRGLWDTAFAETVQRAVGGLNPLLQAQVLFAFVRQHQGGSDRRRAHLQSQEAQERVLRKLRDDEERRCAPQGQGPVEQQPGEHSDFVPSVPHDASSWLTGVCPVAAGVPNRVDKLRGLGNAVVPQIAEWIGRRIMEAHNELV